MAYARNTWEKGELISALKLNNIEEGISDLDTKLSKLGKSIEVGIYDNDTENSADITIPTKTDGTPDDDSRLISARAVRKAIENLDYTDTADSTKYVSEVDEVNGKINVSRVAFNPQVSWQTDIEDNNKLKLGILIANNHSDSGTKQAVPVATTDVQTTANNITTTTYGNYGVTRLSSYTDPTNVSDAATPAGVWDAINTLNKTDTTDRSGSYVQKVTETNGIINYTHNNLSPQISWNTPTTEAGEGNSDKPRLTISVGGISSNATSDAPVASTTLYGVTKLNNTNSSNDQATAATPKCVYDAIHTLISGGTLDANLTPTTMAVGTNDTHLATTAFVAAEIASKLSAADAMMFKGVINTNNDLPIVHEAGWTYKVATAGTYAGNICEIGDLVICITDSASDATTANDAHWAVVQNNVDGALFRGANTFTNEHILIADQSLGKVKDSGYTIATSVPSGAVFTDTTYTFANGTNGFTVTPSNGIAQTVTVTPSIALASENTNGLMSSNDYSKLAGLGTASVKDIPASGDAAATEVVLGNDSRLAIAANLANWAKASNPPSASDIGAASATTPTITLTAPNGVITFTDGVDNTNDVTFTLAELNALKALIPTT